MSGKPSQQELAVQRTLEKQLAPEEHLLGYTVGNLSEGLGVKRYYVGATSQRMLLLPLEDEKPTNQLFSIRRDFIAQVRASRGGGSVLMVELLGDTLSIVMPGTLSWVECSRELIDNWGTASANPPLTSQTLGQQLKDLRHLKLHSTADKVLESALAANPGLAQEESLSALKTDTKESLLALRVAGAFLLFIDTLNLIFSLAIMRIAPDVTVNLLPVFVSMAIDVFIAASFLRGHTQYRIWAIVRATLGFVVFGFFGAIAREAYLQVAMSAALNSAVVLVVTGRSTRTRTWVASGLYLLGVVLYISYLIMLVSLIG